MSGCGFAPIDDGRSSADGVPCPDDAMQIPLFPLHTVLPALAGDQHVYRPTLGEGVFQVPVGPVHAGIIEPGHFRFTASGETVVRLEQRLGYVHKGIEGLMAGASLEQAARLAGRCALKR